jgi:hypothetical protein
VKRTGDRRRRRFPREEPSETYEHHPVADDRLTDPVHAEQRLQERVAGGHRGALGDHAPATGPGLEGTRSRIGQEIRR